MYECSNAAARIIVRVCVRWTSWQHAFSPDKKLSSRWMNTLVVKHQYRSYTVSVRVLHNKSRWAKQAEQRASKGPLTGQSMRGEGNVRWPHSWSASASTHEFYFLAVHVCNTDSFPACVSWGERRHSYSANDRQRQRLFRSILFPSQWRKAAAITTLWWILGSFTAVSCSSCVNQKRLSAHREKDHSVESSWLTVRLSVPGVQRSN